MFGKCTVENIGTAARGADNENWTNCLLTHYDAPRYFYLAVVLDRTLDLVSDSSLCCLIIESTIVGRRNISKANDCDTFIGWFA